MYTTYNIVKPFVMVYTNVMKSKKGNKKLMNKKFTFTTSQEFLDILSEARWQLKMSQSELIRKAVMDYLGRHLPKEGQGKILKKGEHS